MGQASNSEDSQAPVKSKRSSSVRWVPIVVVILIVGAALVVLSRPTPGRRTTTDTSASVIVTTAEGNANADFPIVLQEGGDASHEFDHIVEPLQGVAGVSSATLDWSSGLVLTVTFDTAAISAQEVADRLAASGYLAPASQP